MNIVIGDLLTVEGEKYITLQKINYEGFDYVFVNKTVSDDEVSDEFYIMKVVNDGVSIVIEEELKNILIPKFQELLIKDMNELLK